MSEKIKRVLFDLDGTLIDTERIKRLFREIAMIHGYDEAEAFAIYEEARTSGEMIAISYRYFIEVLKKHLLVDGRDYNEEKVKLVMDDLKSEPILLPGAKELIEEVRSLGLEHHLISLGVPEWQEEKVALSGLDRYFSFNIEDKRADIICTVDNRPEARKQEVLHLLLGDKATGADTVLFNDKPWETARLLRQYPELRAYIRIDSHDNRYKPEDFMAVREEFGNRVTCDSDLNILREDFLNLIRPEKYDGRRA